MLNTKEMGKLGNDDGRHPFTERRTKKKKAAHGISHQN
jgi:hypothetical protein